MGFVAHNDPMSAAIRIVDTTSGPEPGEVTSFGVPIVAIADDLTAPDTEYWLDKATFTLTTRKTDDRRAVTVQRLDGGCLLYTLPSATRTRTRSL